MRINRGGKCIEPRSRWKLAVRRVSASRRVENGVGKLLTESEVADCSTRNAKRCPKLSVGISNVFGTRPIPSDIRYNGVQPSTLSITDEKLCPTPQTPLLWLASLKLTGEISDPNRSAFPRGTAQISKLAHSQELQRIDMIPFCLFLWSYYRTFYHCCLWL